MQGKSGGGERETRNGSKEERRTERQTRTCSERTLHITLHLSAMATATATEKEAGAASSGGRGSARCTAPMSHAGQGTATEKRGRDRRCRQVENEALEICLVCWAPDHLVVARQAHLDTRLVLRARDIGSWRSGSRARILSRREHPRSRTPRAAEDILAL